MVGGKQIILKRTPFIQSFIDLFYFILIVNHFYSLGKNKVRNSLANRVITDYMKEILFSYQGVVLVMSPRAESHFVPCRETHKKCFYCKVLQYK